MEGAVGAEEAGRVDDGSDGRQRVDDLTTFYFLFRRPGRLDGGARRECGSREIGTP